MKMLISRKVVTASRFVMCSRISLRQAGSCFLVVSLLQILYWSAFWLGEDFTHSDNLLPLSQEAVPVQGFGIYGGAGESSLVRPMDVLAAGERIYVSDAGSQRVLIFDSNGVFLSAFGGTGDSQSRFLFPYGLAVSGDTLFVADLYSGKISSFDMDGTFKAYFPEDQVAGAPKAPAALASFEGQLYVTDIKLARVLVYNIATGNLVREIGLGEDIAAPNGVAVDRFGYVYVTSALNQSVAVYSSDGKPVRLINGSDDGHGASILLNPRGIAVGTDNLLYIVSQLTNEVLVFNGSGRQLSSFGQAGGGEEDLFLPNGLCQDGFGRLLVADTGNRRVIVSDPTAVMFPVEGLQSDVTGEKPPQPPVDDGVIYNVVEDYISALVKDDRKAVLALLTQPHRREWQQDSFLLSASAAEYYPNIELIDFSHTFVSYGRSVPPDSQSVPSDIETASLVVYYQIRLSNGTDSRNQSLREQLVLRLDGEQWLIAGSSREILP